MSAAEFYESGFNELENMLKTFEEAPDRAIEALEAGAEAFAADVRAQPRPRSQTSAAGYTHLLDTVSYRTVKEEVEVGWGKYYGPMQERGTRKMNGTPHLAPVYEKNKNKYSKKMQEILFK